MFGGAEPARERIGPGRLVLVVGPSGAGKDTLIRRAAELCCEDAGIVFARRGVTRPVSEHEDHFQLAADEFMRRKDGVDFALWWQAHGLGYAIPASYDDDVRAGRTLVCNGSRSVIERARARYRSACIVLVTAPPEQLMARIADRGSDDADALRSRLARMSCDEDLRCDVRIDNIGTIDAAARELVDAIRRGP